MLLHTWYRQGFTRLYHRRDLAQYQSRGMWVAASFGLNSEYSIVYIESQLVITWYTIQESCLFPASPRVAPKTYAQGPMPVLTGPSFPRPNKISINFQLMTTHTTAKRRIAGYRGHILEPTAHPALSKQNAPPKSPIRALSLMGGEGGLRREAGKRAA